LPRFPPFEQKTPEGWGTGSAVIVKMLYEGGLISLEVPPAAGM
jgi:hypothetical protein